MEHLRLYILGIFLMIALPHITYAQLSTADSIKHFQELIDQEKKTQAEYENAFKLQESIIKDRKDLNKKYKEKLKKEENLFHALQLQVELINMSKELVELKKELVLLVEYKRIRDSSEQLKIINTKLNKNLDSIKTDYDNKKKILELYSNTKNEFCSQWGNNIRLFKEEDYFRKTPPNPTEYSLLDSCASIVAHRAFIDSYSQAYFFIEFGNSLNWKHPPCIDSLNKLDTLFKMIDILPLSKGQQEQIKIKYKYFKDQYIKSVSDFFVNEINIVNIIKELNAKNKEITISGLSYEFQKKIIGLITSPNKTKKETTDKINIFSKLHFCNN
jgi:hypothetical protein